MLTIPTRREVLAGAAASTLLSLFGPGSGVADEPEEDSDSETAAKPELALTPDRLSISSPVAYQVFQRTGYHAAQVHPNAVGGPQIGSGLIEVVATVRGPLPEQWEWRWALHADAPPSASRSVGEWEAFEPVVTPFADPNRDQGSSQAISAQVRLPAGGWYELELRGGLADGSHLAGSVNPVGVGEVFLVAGQSYAEGANDELMKVTDLKERVAALDVQSGRWQVAHDPQPHKGDGGTIWPPLGDLLAPLLWTPVGFVNAAVGGTSSTQWLPGGKLFADLVAAGQAVGAVRAVLWQQGESDVIEKRTTADYVANLRAIRQAFEQESKIDAPWLLAKSTYHPTVYNDPVHEEAIRQALAQLAAEPGFGPGPDTDILQGPDRGEIGTRRHFTGSGQRRAALLWFAAVWELLRTADA